jgi:hypothetical protein
MLYMKTRVTFRISDDLAEALRDLPNQTKFVEDALRDALGRTCPVCGGTGRVSPHALAVTNVRSAGIKRLSRDQAVQLQRVFRVGQAVAATRIELKRSGRQVAFRVSRDRAEVLSGLLSDNERN